MRTFTIFRDFRRLVEALQQLVGVLRELLHVQRGAGPALDRISALELSRHQFEAEIQGVLLKADGKLKAANNAEARERQLKKSYERDADPFGDPSEEVAEAGRPVLVNDAAERQGERVPSLRVGLAPDRKAAALTAKWSR